MVEGFSEYRQDFFKHGSSGQAVAPFTELLKPRAGCRQRMLVPWWIINGCVEFPQNDRSHQDGGGALPDVPSMKDRPLQPKRLCPVREREDDANTETPEASGFP